MKNTTTITIDLAKDVYQVAVLNKFGKKLTNKGMNSKRLVQLVLQHPGSCIYMEACGSAHYWGRRFTKLGYTTQLIPPHLVAKYRNGNKQTCRAAYVETQFCESLAGSWNGYQNHPDTARAQKRLNDNDLHAHHA